MSEDEKNKHIVESLKTAKDQRCRVICLERKLSGIKSDMNSMVEFLDGKYTGEMRVEPDGSVRVFLSKTVSNTVNFPPAAEIVALWDELKSEKAKLDELERVKREILDSI